VTPRLTTLWSAAVIAAVTLTTSCATTPPARPPPTATQSARPEQGVTDNTLANTVYSELNADPVYFYRHVDVRVDGGVVDLSGYVWSTDAIYHARRIASSVPGVTRVVTSSLELERNGRGDSNVSR
jgi:BON domain